MIESIFTNKTLIVKDKIDDINDVATWPEVITYYVKVEMLKAGPGLLSGSSDTRQLRLRSRRPFVPGARNLLDNLARLGIHASAWTNHKWETKYCENASRLRAFVPETGARPVGIGLPRSA